MDDSTMPEEWRTLPGWEGAYEVSDRGRVRSLDRVTYDSTGRAHPTKGRVMKLQDRDGYKHLALSFGPKRATGWLHQMVARAFIGPCPPGLEVCHNDGDSSNNAPENLRYGTRSDNLHDRRIHGTEYHQRLTHCPHGHEYSPDNILVKDGTRRCLTCHRARSRETHRRRTGYYERRGIDAPNFEDAIKGYAPARPIADRSLAALDRKVDQIMDRMDEMFRGDDE